ncbi:MAG: hypothetical protein GY862_04280 [Gammaproteobacteria bacterium]|nr:hypothetical protein [Gammaproteobacteria bacterium]
MIHDENLYQHNIGNMRSVFHIRRVGENENEGKSAIRPQVLLQAGIPLYPGEKTADLENIVPQMEGSKRGHALEQDEYSLETRDENRRAE